MRMWMNSKYVKKGDCFLVDKHNEKYVLDAIEKGVIKIVTEQDQEYDIKTVKVKSIKDYLHDNYYKNKKKLKTTKLKKKNNKKNKKKT